ncbi:hypothetical protein [Dendronalium sp. ChiSLP03b]|uniref:hypothetical protein n=1 Tax=Dendronalium sp. ChiSLP03b TaxID=3075381 RepID=UPI002AD256B5|nr:hypothetical protein [Dendronalium sp. ChiSLP03b]MDZ8207050.1 hypothetical protein [Dendronalium sp. ChiSLP03b]
MIYSKIQGKKSEVRSKTGFIPNFETYTGVLNPAGDARDARSRSVSPWEKTRVPLRYRS